MIFPPNSAITQRLLASLGANRRCFLSGFQAAMALFCMITPISLRAADAVNHDGAAGHGAVRAMSAPAARSPEAGLSSGATNQVNVLDDKYHLAIGDQLSFRIVEDEDDPKVLTVTDSGELEVPYIGRFPAVGKTCKELARELKTELEKTYYLQATVIIAVDSKPRSRGKVYLVGAIGVPGPQDISGDETLTVSKAILRAGGLTSFANGKEVRVTRSIGKGAGDETNFTVNVSLIYEKGTMEEDLPLRPGDFIFVPERMIRF